MDEKTLAQDFRSVELAYPLAIASYDLAQKRLDVVEGRLQTLLAFVPPVTIAVIATANGKGAPFTSYWFIGAMLLCLFGLTFGVHTRLADRVIVIDPAVLSQKWLHFSEWQFKRNVIHLSGIHFDKNATVIARKGRRTSLAAIIFLLEALFLGAWIVAHNL
jgi:hypothetical protein